MPQTLDGLRILELGQLVAAPSAGRIFADFGADVIKVEPLDGDPLRQWGNQAPSGSSWWWMTQARNKRLIAVNLKTSVGQEIIRKLAGQVDVILENLRPGTLDAWHLGYDQISEINPHIIYASISGFGQTGPYRDRPGFGNIAEAMGGIRYITGFPDRPPVRTGMSLGDELAALQAVIGVLLALYRREREPARRGEHIDVALTESVLSITEALIPEYLNASIVQERTGNQLLRAAPSNTYPTLDGGWIAVGANSSKTFHLLMQAMDREDLAQDERFKNNAGRVAHAAILDRIIAEWTGQYAMEELMDILIPIGVPAGPVMTAKDIVDDVQVKARALIEYVLGNGSEEVGMLGVLPKLSKYPGQIRWAGGSIGQDTDKVLQEFVEASSRDLAAWREMGIIR